MSNFRATCPEVVLAAALCSWDLSRVLTDVRRTEVQKNAHIHVLHARIGDRGAVRACRLPIRGQSIFRTRTCSRHPPADLIKQLDDAARSISAGWIAAELAAYVGGALL